MAENSELYSLEDIAKAAEAALEGEDVEGFAADPLQHYGRIGMQFLDHLAATKGGPLAPGCCTQGCCDDFRFKV